MTVSSETSKSGPYSGNGSQTVFAYGFRILADADIRVVKTSTTGVETDLTLTTDYTVSGAGDSGGGNVTLVTAPATGEKITILRDMTFTQAVDLRNQGGFYPEVHERVFDRLSMQVQQVKEKVDRAVTVDPSSSTDPADLLDEIETNAAAAASSASDAQAAQTAAEAAQTAAEAAQTGAEAAETSAQASAAAAAVAAASGLFGTLSNKTANFSITADTDNATLFIVDTSGGSVQATLPSIATAGEGERYGFLRPSASNTLTLVRNGSDTINGVAGDYTVPAVAGEILVLLADDTTPDNWIVINWTQAVADESTLTKSGSTISIKSGGVGLTQMATAAKTEVIAIACSDETTALTAGTGKIAFRMPYAFTVTAVRASLTTAQTSGSTFTVDINETGTSILGTKLTIDNTEKTSTTAATAATITDTALADDAEITVDIDAVGDGTAKGLKVYLIGYKA